MTNAEESVGQSHVSLVRFSVDRSGEASGAIAKADGLAPIRRQAVDDVVAVESPLEIRIVFGPQKAKKDRSLSITMRTPGADEALAAGFLLSEGIVDDQSAIDSFEFCGPIDQENQLHNQLRVNLGDDVEVDISRLQRHFYTTSSCGVCGKASLDAVAAQGVEPIDRFDQSIQPANVLAMPQRLHGRQSIFDSTGGLHAAGQFDFDGKLLKLCEDVGRHNAVDKLVGTAMIEGQLESMQNSILVVSGRASFELVQKAVIAKIPIMVAVGAPSSLAVDLAQRFGVTLVGFNSGQKFNVYSHSVRISPQDSYES